MVNEKILDLANHISRKKRGTKSEIKATDPEYLILEPVVTDAMADAAMHMVIRTKYTAESLAPLCGMTVEETAKQLYELAEVGVCFVNEIDGVDHFWYDTWVPGIMEMMAGHKENVAKYPQITQAFEAYGRVRGPMSAGSFPVGVGLMRVIPIESAIDGNSRRASYEEISKYLNENTIFTVSDCSCRTVREEMGEGCGHLKEDMCIQMGHAAEYYIRTGRGRQITREEAFEIIDRAEENGLMHQIPNLDGSGHTHAICNCCGCSCLSLRSAGMFYNGDMVRSNYVAKVDKNKCVACGECVENCPVNALQLGQKVCSSTKIIEDITKKETPRDTEWGPENWNVDYRYNRKNVVETGTSPCKTECPAHIAVQGYIKLAAQGRYTDALALIKKNNPFPAVCGRICPHGCESACTRGELDEPIAIDEIKKFIAQQDLDADNRYVPKKRHAYGKRIAVVGAGPSGLSCAYYLALDGYEVTVFEKQKVLGGMLTTGIPTFRLEKDVINAEIDILREMGVQFKTGIEIGRDKTIQDLRSEGYKAFYLAIGAQGGRKLGVEGENAPEVISGISFLRDVNTDTPSPVSGKVIVIGGGNVAIDVARTAARLPVTSVSLYSLESRSEMPALSEEIEEALQEEISIHNSWGPKRIIIENGRVTGVEFKKCISVFDENQRFNPVFDENQIMFVSADYVLLSIGQSIESSDLLLNTVIERNPNGTIKADYVTLQTSEPDIFVGGDAFTGPKYAIHAIAAGKEGAISIHRFVNRGQSLTIGRDRKEYRSLDKKNVLLDSYDTMPRQTTKHESHTSSIKSFHDPRLTFTKEQVMKETERCLGCGVTIVDEYSCVGCGQCTTKCKFDAITLERRYDGEGVRLEDLKPVVIKNILKRKVRITTKKVKKLFLIK